MAALFIVGGMAYTLLKPDGYAEHRAQLVDIFNLPEDANFVMFRSPYRRGLNYVEGIVAFDADQWESYVDVIDDRSAWDPTGFEHRGTEITARRTLAATRWYDGEYAWINDEYAAFWVNWGFGHRDEDADYPVIWDAPASRSFCLAILETNGEQRMEPCRNYKHTPPGLKWYIRGKLSEQERLLYMYLR